MGLFVFFRNFWILAQSDGFRFVKVGWVFFIFSVVTGLTVWGRAAAICPAGAPLHPSAPGQTAQHRQQGRPCQNQGGASTRADHARHDTRPGAGHAAPVCTRYQTGHAGQIIPEAGSVSGKVYNFGLSILSIFIWICFVKSIDNPYIYGYNIISPDKCGLQPQYTKTGGLKMITLDFSQWAALWYVGGMISGALVMIAFFNS